MLIKSNKEFPKKMIKHNMVVCLWLPLDIYALICKIRLTEYAQCSEYNKELNKNLIM